MAEAERQMTGLTVDLWRKLEHKRTDLAVYQVDAMHKEAQILLDLAEQARRVDTPIALTELAQGPSTSDDAFWAPSLRGRIMRVEHRWHGTPVVSSDEMTYIKSVNSGKLNVGRCTHACGHASCRYTVRSLRN
jgi:hypothetical protein